SVHDLFLDLATHENQLEFPLLYGSSRFGFASTDQNQRSGDMKPLFDAIIKHVPAPEEKNTGLQILITNLDHSDFLGPIAIGRVFSGELRVGQHVVSCKGSFVSAPTKVTKIYTFSGLDKIEKEMVAYGDI